LWYSNRYRIHSSYQQIDMFSQIFFINWVMV
jgi:hypothetical protein